MKRMIDTEKFLDKLLYMGYMDEEKSEVEEVANNMTEDAYTKNEVITMLTEIQMEIEEHEESIIGHYSKETKESDFPSHKIERNNGRKECVNLIQQKINELKGERNDD